MAIQQSAFQVASIMTTTGYSTTDFNMWPGLSKAIILCLMAVGACAGSTGGGLKYARVILLLKSLRRNIKRLLHPQNIQTIRADGQTVNEKVIDATNIYLVTYVFIIVFSFLLVAFDGFSIETNISAVISCFNNIGPGFGDVGPLGNFGGFSAFSKLVLIVDMLAGRLEIFPILVLFSRRTWNNG
jgi:trk system potassium uptake protein TrkH